MIKYNILINFYFREKGFKLSKKILISLIVSAFIFCGIAAAQTTSPYSGSSITDFTIHKVIPKKTIPAKNNTSYEEIKVNNAKKPAARKTPGAAKNHPFTIVKKNIKKAKKPIPKPGITHHKTPVTHPETRPSVTKTHISPEKAASKTTHAAKTSPIPEKYHKETVVEQQGINSEEKISAKDREHQKQIPEYKDDYVENLNKYLADDDIASNSREITTSSTLDSYDYFIKPFLSLGVVIFLMLILAWIYSKMKGISPNQPLFGKFGDPNINKFKILATSTLGQGKVIQLVEINGKQLVVGSTNQNINLLTEISPDEMEQLMAKTETQKGNRRQGSAIPDDEQEYSDPDNYSARYSDLYREYTDKNDK